MEQLYGLRFETGCVAPTWLVLHDHEFRMLLVRKSRSLHKAIDYGEKKYYPNFTKLFMQPEILTARLIYVAVAAGMLFWALMHLESRRKERRRMERFQQVIVVLHFLAVGGWFLRHTLGFVVRESNLTAAGTAYEVSGVISALGIGAASILVNPGVRWNRFFLTFGIVAVVHALTFGAIALRWGNTLGMVPDLEEIINDKKLFGMEESVNTQATRKP